MTYGSLWTVKGTGARAYRTCHSEGFGAGKGVHDSVLLVSTFRANLIKMVTVCCAETELLLQMLRAYIHFNYLRLIHWNSLISVVWVIQEQMWSQKLQRAKTINFRLALLGLK